MPSRSSGPNEVELAWAHAEPNIHLVREEVAVISVPVGRLPFIGTALNKAVRFVASVVNGTPPSTRASQDATDVTIPAASSATGTPGVTAGTVHTRPRIPI
ncbi:hypothetical protein ACQKIE_02400 [Luteibacter sp. NPDC031894]|uniref:hypothetical protein n=1 Tax=Luteibacter sp. NPDC031894 TaxID=3390572 RepID=UPI003D088814